MDMTATQTRRERREDFMELGRRLTLEGWDVKENDKVEVGPVCRRLGGLLFIPSLPPRFIHKLREPERGGKGQLAIEDQGRDENGSGDKERVLE